MKLKTPVSLVVAIVLGLITAKVGLDLMHNYHGGNALMTRVVVAKKAMTPGYVLKIDDLDSQVVAVNLVPPNALHDPKELVGRTIIAAIAPGQTMLEAMFVDKGKGQGLAAVLKPGMRAVTVDISDSSAVAGMIDRGSMVDVIATLRHGEATIAKAVLENVEVQSVQRGVSGYSRKDGQTTAIESGPVKSVTLFVTPKQASALQLVGENGGRTRLVLRGNGDTTTSDGQMTDRELLGLPPEEPKVETPPAPVAKTDQTFDNVPPPVEDKGKPIEILRNGTSSTVYINEKNGKKDEGSSEETTASARVNPASGDAKDSDPKRAQN